MFTVNVLTDPLVEIPSGKKGNKLNTTSLLLYIDIEKKCKLLKTL